MMLMHTPSATSKKTHKDTSPIFSRIEDCDRVIVELGGRPTTPEESRLFRDAEARINAKIAKPLAAA